MKRTEEHSKALIFHGSAQFRTILSFSILSGRSVMIKSKAPLIVDIRDQDQNPGLWRYELNYLNLISLLTNGTKVEINSQGTQIKFSPGVITNNNGNYCKHECALDRSIVYYLEGVLPLVLFGKHPLKLVLTGYTSDWIDSSIDSFRASILPLLRQFGIQGFYVQVLRKGFPGTKGQPGLVGEVQVKFTSPIKGCLEPTCIDDQGKIKKIRGTVTALKISPEILNRVISSIRKVLNQLLPDVWISSDLLKIEKKDSKTQELRPRCSVSLTAQSTTGSVISVDQMATRDEVISFDEAQALGEKAGEQLLEEIMGSAFVDSSSLPLALLLMAVSSNEHISKIKLRRISKFVIPLIQKLWMFFGVKFKIEECQDDIVYLEDEEESQDDQSSLQASEEQSSHISSAQSLLSAQMKQARSKLPRALIFSCLGCNLTNESRILE